MTTRHLLVPAAILSFIAPSLLAEDPVSFEKSILPILESKCIQCHATEHKDDTGRVKKPKAGLVMDTAEGLTKGGKNTKEKVIVAGKPDESEFLRVVNLPASDDESMPPEGKADPLTDEEKALVKKWITEGARFGDWKAKK